VPARDGTEIDLEAPWRRASLLALVSAAVDDEVTVDTDVATLRRHAAARDVALEPGWGAAEVLLELYEQLVEEELVQPTFVCDYPEAVRPLAKPHRSAPGLNEAFDLIINGVELAPAYSELNDPVVQRERLMAQALLAAAGDPEANDLDEVFLRALEHGLPPAGGMGMGIDRLLMLLMGTGIREAIMFPLLRPV
jgi:lysyl-tRNA synthetase class 2